MRQRIWLGALIAILVIAAPAAAQTVFVYDAVSDISTLTTTASVPHTYVGQAFNISSVAGSTPQITSMRLGTFVLGAQNDAFSRLRVQFWGTFDPTATGTTLVFSNPIGSPLVFNTGAISTLGNAAFIYTLNFGSPITLPSTTNLGISVNWQSSVDGTTYVDDTNLVGAFRAPVGTLPIPVGTNITTGTNVYYRNASGLTTFDFQAGDARILAGQTQATDGLAFQLSAIAVPEPTTIALGVLGTMGGLGLWLRRRRMLAQALNAPLMRRR
jgi:hypothetical protein